MFLWILIVGGIMTFFASMGIGANDVANAFATSIGSKALTMKSAIVIAAIFELAGAVLMGSHVTETIRKGIADYQCFEDNPYVLMYGCMYVLFSVGVWLFLASKYEMPVSTTHSCVGGMIGMTIALGGIDCVNWYTPKDTFPYVGGVSGIVLSWLFSPVLSLLFAVVIFSITRFAVLRRKNSFNISFYSFPIFVGLTLMLNIFFIIYKGGKGIGLDDLEVYIAVPVSILSGVLVGAIMIPFMPLLKKCILKRMDKRIILASSGILFEPILIASKTSLSFSAFSLVIFLVGLSNSIGLTINLMPATSQRWLMAAPLFLKFSTICLVTSEG